MKSFMQKTGEKVHLMPRAFMRPWEKQPRKHFDAEKMRQLVESMKAVGQLQALLVRALAVPSGEVTHEIIVGERRWRASEAAGMDYLSVLVVTLDDKEALEVSVMENINRADLDVIEEADGYEALRREGWTVAEIVQRSGRGDRAIYELLNLTKLDAATQDEVRCGSISRKVAEALGMIEDLKDREKALKDIVQPTYQKQPLAREDALRLINHGYLEPQKAAKEWEGTCKKLAKKYPKQKVFGMREYDEVSDEFVNLDAEIPGYLLAVQARDREQAWTWDELAEKHKVVCDYAPDEDGKPMRVVRRQPLVELEKATGAETPELCLFPLPGKGRHDQGLESLRRKEEERRETEKELAENEAARKEAIAKIYQGLCHATKGWKGEDLDRKCGGLLRWAIDVEAFPDMDVLLEELEIDAAAKGDGEVMEGVLRHAEELGNKSGTKGVAALLLAWAVMCINPGFSGFEQEMKNLQAVLND